MVFAGWFFVQQNCFNFVVCQVFYYFLLLLVGVVVLAYDFGDS